jgi:signal transduction histidine kinase/ligand-binding sensor domain-containing protein/DNA-binding response OmpR family regulator
LTGGFLKLGIKKNLLYFFSILFCSVSFFDDALPSNQQNSVAPKEIIPQTNSQQHLRFEHIGQKQGLAQKGISCFAQDKQGYLWLGTSNGLLRYDGYEFRTFKHQPGDSTTIHRNEISALFVDSRGWLWIGTSNGLSCYDQNTDCFLQISTLSESFEKLQFCVNTICEDETGAIWTGTYYGLIRFSIPDDLVLGKQNVASVLLEKRVTENLTHILIDSQDSTSYDNDISTMLLDNRGILWFGTPYGLKLLLPAISGKSLSLGTSWKVMDIQKFKETPQAVLSGTILQLLEDTTGAIWVSTQKGLTRIDVQMKNSPEALSLEFKDYPIKDNWRFFRKDVLFEFFGDNGSKIWIGRSDQAFAVFDPNSETFSNYDRNQDNNSEGQIPNNVLSIYRDRSGVIWIGTARDGLFKYDPHKNGFSNYHPALEKIPQISAINLRFVFEDSHEGLWIGHETLYRCNRVTGEIIAKFLPFFPKTLWDFKNDILEDRTGIIWIAGEGLGLYRFDPVQNRIIAHYSLNDSGDTTQINDNVTALTLDQHGNIWAVSIQYNNEKDNQGRWLQFLYEFDTNGSQLNKFMIALAENNSESKKCFVYDLVVDSSGIVWLGTEFGLTRFDPLSGVVKQYQNNPGKSASKSYVRVNAVLIDPYNQQRFLWLGTNGNGLLRFNKEAGIFETYSTRDGLSSNVIGSILSDNSGNLWLGTDQGISKVVLNEESREIILVRNYDRKDGLKSTNFSFYYGQNAHKNARGEMFFAGTDGFNIFDPASLGNLNPPPVSISNFQINFKPVSFRDSGSPLRVPISNTQEIVLPFKDNTFSFELVALDFHTPGKNLYAYKLEGFQKNWIDIGNSRNAIFTQVEPGKYTFRAKAANSYGVWNDEGVSLKITILPPWYRTWWAYVIYVFLTLGIIYGWRRFELNRREAKHRFKLKNVEAQKLQELDKMKSRFFANISHEFRTPLTLILGPLEKFLSNVKDKKEKQNLNLMQRNAKRLLKLINELLDLSKLESGQMTLQVTQLDIIQHLKKCLAFFESAANDKGINLKFQTEEESVIGFFDADKLQKIFVNLISNAVKFTLEGGDVFVSVVIDNSYIPPGPPSKGGVHFVSPFEGRRCPKGRGLRGMLEIKVKDTGIGIAKNRLSQIFNRFYQTEDSHTGEGTGIGLALTKELVELHHGVINVESEQGKGTTFKVCLPLGKDHLKPEKILEPPEQPTEIDTINIPDPLMTNGQLTNSQITNPPTTINDTIVLVVEDNADMRAYISGQLKEDFKILEAVNGEQGIKMAIENIPDLIISDVMMPKKNGYELCQALKTDERTSHIPIILLTAKAALDDKLSGYQTGADDYMFKPFHAEELLLRSQNLIRTRQQLCLRYSQAPIIKPKELGISAVDQSFLQKVIEIVQDNLTQENFGVEELGKKIGMSASTLRRKFRGLLNQHPKLFIRTIRLQHAHQMLEAAAGNVTEIALATGFENPAYFAQCFKEKYGISPSEFKRRNI